MRGLHIGRLAVGRVPRIVGTAVSAESLDSAARIAKPAFDLLEIRVDCMDSRWPAGAIRLREAGIPLILTVRSALEGGAWRGAEAERKRVYLSNLAVADAVDVEIRSRALKTVARAARRRGRLVIGSFHDFDGTPSMAVLRRIVWRGRAAGAHVVKIATHVGGEADLERLLDLLAESREPLCVLGMGPRGAAARVRLARAGSCLTYGYVDRPAAPGQPSCRELAGKLRRARLTA
ncbi:MAG TPA: type I 3-dehydroquinate dehydratase [Kiritimatiellia bacterium]|nr:type I 3-dehydroquinate dehydratase [Kiritimatiellia bacterium]HRZ11967.1 type I 3-dehydroquinate dehydratase [Kiritimatiellia bacterium]HSA17227.1 type I 3-dehydroquinate dehydratase [Kiritimatiellia bacterium]